MKESNNMKEPKYFIQIKNQNNEYCNFEAYDEGTDKQKIIEGFNKAQKIFTGYPHKFTSIEEISDSHIPLQCECSISLDIAEVKLSEDTIFLYVNGKLNEKTYINVFLGDDTSEIDLSKVDVVFEYSDYSLNYNE